MTSGSFFLQPQQATNDFNTLACAQVIKKQKQKRALGCQTAAFNVKGCSLAAESSFLSNL